MTTTNTHFGGDASHLVHDAIDLLRDCKFPVDDAASLMTHLVTLKEPIVLNIGVVGEFNSGKSSLLNALLHLGLFVGGYERRSTRARNLSRIWVLP